MLTFDIKLNPRLPIYEQIVFAVKRAVAAGRLRPEDRFPSVRDISEKLKINPNTVQRAVSELNRAGLLEVRPGQGCFIARQSAMGSEGATSALRPLAERLVVEAMQYRITQSELSQIISQEWKRIQK